MVGIAPVLVLSVATRVQARRVELGTQAARTYIDGVRSGKNYPSQRHSHS
jgi:type II secretory pathway pseudopilin PulG